MGAQKQNCKEGMHNKEVQLSPATPPCEPQHTFLSRLSTAPLPPAQAAVWPALALRATGGEKVANTVSLDAALPSMTLTTLSSLS